MYMAKEITFVATDEQHTILSSMSFAASKLWNVANYERKHYKDLKLERYPDWYDQKKRLKTHYWFKAMPAHTSQLVLRRLHEAWKSFYALVASGGIENPKPPRFKHEGIFLPFDASTAIKREAGNVFRFTISKQERAFLQKEHHIKQNFLRLELPTFAELGTIKEITFYPFKEKQWRAIAVHEVEEPDLLPDNGRYLSIDLGVRNFASCYSNIDGGTCFILGKRFLELNHYYNKQIAHYQGISDRQQVAMGVEYPQKSRRVLGLYRKYKNSVDDLLHKCSTYIRDYCVTNHINTVVVGDITGIRDGNNLGHRNNQALHALPYKKFVDKLAYKLRLEGITLFRQEESYSSQCSPLTPAVSKEFATPGKRIHRGLYKDNGCVFHADVVGAYNILRKAVKAEFLFPSVAPRKVSV